MESITEAGHKMIASKFLIIIGLICIHVLSCASTGAPTRARNTGLRACTVRDVIDEACDPVREAKAPDSKSRY